MQQQNVCCVDWSFVEKVVFINLASRSDRHQRLLQELAQLGISDEKILRFDAIATTPGYIGCARSQLGVLEMAQREGWRNVLILEDDMVFDHSESAAERLNHFFYCLRQQSWDVAFLAANYYQAKVHDVADSFLFDEQSTLLKIRAAACACAWLVPQHYYPTIIANVRLAVKRMLRTGSQKDSIDVTWYPLMKQDIWLGIYPCFGYQNPGVSNIQNGVIDYKYLFFKQLEDICSYKK